MYSHNITVNFHHYKNLEAITLLSVTRESVWKHPEATPLMDGELIFFYLLKNEPSFNYVTGPVEDFSDFLLTLKSRYL